MTGIKDRRIGGRRYQAGLESKGYQSWGHVVKMKFKSSHVKWLTAKSDLGCHGELSKIRETKQDSLLFAECENLRKVWTGNMITLNLFL